MEHIVSIHRGCNQRRRAADNYFHQHDGKGTGDGYDLELTRRILNAVTVPVITSGGAGTLNQIAEVLLSTASPETDSSVSPNEAPGADSALVASMLHFGKATIREIKKHAEAKGVCVRWWWVAFLRNGAIDASFI